MDGVDIKYLHTYLQDGDGEPKLVWSRYGNQGRKWRVASVTFSVVVHQTSHIVMKVERGMVTSPWIIAINDVRIEDGACYVSSQRPHVQIPGKKADIRNLVLWREREVREIGNKK